MPNSSAVVRNKRSAVDRSALTSPGDETNTRITFIALRNGAGPASPCVSKGWFILSEVAALPLTAIFADATISAKGIFALIGALPSRGRGTRPNGRIAAENRPHMERIKSHACRKDPENGGNSTTFPGARDSRGRIQEVRQTLEKGTVTADERRVSVLLTPSGLRCRILLNWGDERSRRS
jgi:hypothetical protein